MMRLEVARARFHRRPSASRQSRSFRCHASLDAPPPLSSSTSSSSAGDGSIAARIAAAKKYKEMAGSGTASTSQKNTAPMPTPSTPSKGPPPPVDYSAMTEFIQNPLPKRSSSSSPALSPVSLPITPDSAPSSVDSTISRALTPPAAQATPGAPPAPDPASSGVMEGMGAATAVAAASAAEARQVSPLAPLETVPEPPAPSNPIPFLQRTSNGLIASADIAKMVMSATQAPGRGSATEAASSIAAVLSFESTIDPDMRPEQYSLLKEERMKQMGAQIITVDQNYNPGVRADPSAYSGLTINPDAPPAAPERPLQPMYQPKVSTWGAFPRPNNISEAYGGGRNITPGQALETEEQKAAREVSFNLAMKSYREKMGLDVDPQLEINAQAFYDEGMDLFRDGSLKPAYDKFLSATELVPVRSKVGGLATLQKAIVLDSLGYSDDAKKLYKQLRGHAVANVARKAKQMVFGFEAASFMKADTISYAPKKADYIKYFRVFADRNQMYVATEEDRIKDAEMARLSAIVAVSVLLGPLALLGSLVMQHSLQ